MLRGVVLGPDGEPIPGASVSIQTATPKVGVPILCPSCYLDCGRSARTEADGSFRIEQVDPALKFTVLAVAEGYRPTTTKFIDPAGDPLTLSIEPRPEPVDEPGRLFRGRIVNLDGEPVPNAMVWAGMYHWEEGSGSTRLDGADTVVVARDDGTFEFTFPTPLVRFGLRAAAKGYAERHLDRIRVAPERYDFVLGPGAIIKGKLVDAGGTPIVGQAVGLCGTNRSIRVFDGHWTIATDDRGVFTFTNIPASGQPRLLTDSDNPNMHFGDPGVDVSAYVYTMIADADLGSIEPVKVPVPEHGGVTDLGTIACTTNALRITGRVVLPPDETGSPVTIPEGSRLMISRDHAWDSAIITIDESDGRFDVPGLWQSEPVSIHVNIPGYRLSPENPNYHHSWMALVGLPTGDPLRVLVEPGGRLESESRADWKLQQQPLRSPED